MFTNVSGLFLKADEGDSTFMASGEFATWKATAETTEGRYDQVEFVILPQSGSVQHTHTQDELYYFLAGTFRVKVGDQVFTASMGDFVRIPAGISHAYRCIGKNASQKYLSPMSQVDYEDSLKRYVQSS